MVVVFGNFLCFFSSWWLLLVVSLVVVVVACRWRGGGKVAIFMWLFLLWLGFDFVHSGGRETGEEGRERKLERGNFFLVINFSE